MMTEEEAVAWSGLLAWASQNNDAQRRGEASRAARDVLLLSRWVARMRIQEIPKVLGRD